MIDAPSLAWLAAEVCLGFAGRSTEALATSMMEHSTKPIHISLTEVRQLRAAPELRARAGERHRVQAAVDGEGGSDSRWDEK